MSDLPSGGYIFFCFYSPTSGKDKAVYVAFMLRFIDPAGLAAGKLGLTAAPCGAE
jgi:hypothetical protein